MRTNITITADQVGPALDRGGNPQKVYRLAAAALFAEGWRIMNRSRELVPVDEGILKGSGFVGEPEITAGRQHVNVTVGYGGAAKNYAVPQHERTDYRHTVGQAKYLEEPVNDATVGFGARIAADMARLFQ